MKKSMQIEYSKKDRQSNANFNCCLGDLISLISRSVLLKSSTVFLCVIFASYIVFGQKDIKHSNLDSSGPITLKSFDKLVIKSIDLMKNTPIADISDSEHINIMMCLNTIQMSTRKGTLGKKFTDEIYKELQDLSVTTYYIRDIIKVYPKWIPNKGMGYYFPALNMELGGTPRAYARFHVLK